MRKSEAGSLSLRVNELSDMKSRDFWLTVSARTATIRGSAAMTECVCTDPSFVREAPDFDDIVISTLVEVVMPSM